MGIDGRDNVVYPDFTRKLHVADESLSVERVRSVLLAVSRVRHDVDIPDTGALDYDQDSESFEQFPLYDLIVMLEELSELDLEMRPGYCWTLANTVAKRLRVECGVFGLDESDDLLIDTAVNNPFPEELE